jgi:hypothetical protein
VDLDQTSIILMNVFTDLTKKPGVRCSRRPINSRKHNTFQLSKTSKTSKTSKLDIISKEHAVGMVMNASFIDFCNLVCLSYDILH